MITKADLPLTALQGRGLSSLAAAYFELNQLKQLYRQGWLRRGIPPERCESVAEHVFGMAVLGWWIAVAYFPALDRDKIMRMTLAHELGEIYVGDLTPADGIARAEKHRREREAIGEVVGKLPKGAEYLALWDEFEQGQTPEARFVRQLDRLEMAFQAAVYQTQGLADLSEFFDSAAAILEDQQFKDILAELRGLVA